MLGAHLAMAPNEEVWVLVSLIRPVFLSPRGKRKRLQPLRLLEPFHG